MAKTSLFAALLFLTLGAAGAADLDKSVLAYTLPAGVQWRDSPTLPGNKQAILHGDPNKPGDHYVVRNWFKAGNFSRPHYHANDRFIVVLSGTWWIGTGEKFDTGNTEPMKPGSFVVHYGNKVHYDGAKDEDCVIEIHGIGPAAAIPAAATGR
jgi:transposase